MSTHINNDNNINNRKNIVNEKKANLQKTSKTSCLPPHQP